MPTTIAILSDLHAMAGVPRIAKRMGNWADILLKRAVERFARHIKPDLVLLLGDCIDQEDEPGAMDRLRALRGIMDGLPCPWLAIPGNHDPAPATFYDAFPDPGEQVDVAGVRILLFHDPEAPGYNATRSDRDLARMRAARSDGFAGPVIAAQHVALLPSELAHRLPHGFTNADAVVHAAAVGGIDLCVGGHSHTYTGILRQGTTAFLSVDALCERPFGYTLLTIEDAESGAAPAICDRIRSQNEFLAMPSAYGLVDYHSHTQFAYCSENMDTARSPRLAELMGLKALALTEHSGQLYFPREAYWSGRFAAGGIADAQPADSRMADYLTCTVGLRSDRLLVGLEVDADFDGRLVLRPEDAETLQVIVGAVHVLQEGQKSPIDLEAFVAEFKLVTERLCGTGIHILAHPFRIFRRCNQSPPPALYAWLADVLASTGVAAEINFHTNEPHPEFVRLCVDRGIPITFGSDAHNLYEVGEFYPHLALLRRLGVTGDLADVMWRGPGH